RCTHHASLLTPRPRAPAHSESLVERLWVVNGRTTRPLSLINCRHGRDLDRGLAPTRTQPTLRGPGRATRSVRPGVAHDARRSFSAGAGAGPAVARQPDLDSPGDGGPAGSGLCRRPPWRGHLPAPDAWLRGIAAEAARATAPAARCVGGS